MSERACQTPKRDTHLGIAEYFTSHAGHQIEGKVVEVVCWDCCDSIRVPMPPDHRAVMDDPRMPKHDCAYTSNPDAGNCDFCYSVGPLLATITTLDEKEQWLESRVRWLESRMPCQAKCDDCHTEPCAYRPRDHARHICIGCF